MRHARIARSALLCVLVAESGCLSSSPAAEETQAIIGGTRTAAGADPAVVLLVASYGGGSSSLCTAEIVSPHVVMTAAHCVHPGVVGAVKRYDVFLGNDLDDSQQAADPALWLSVASTAYDSAFNPQNLSGGHDVAVAILAKPTAIVPLSLNRLPLSSAWNGKMVRLVGYGVTDGWQQQGSGVKRVTSTPLTDYDQRLIWFGNAQKGTCQGDSGGPAFMTIGGVEYIVGVTSFGDQGCQEGGYDTRVDTIATAFVDPHIAKHDPATAAPDGGGAADGGAPSNPPIVARDPPVLVADDRGRAADPGPMGAAPAGGCAMGGAPDAASAVGLALLAAALLIAFRRRSR